MRMPAVLLGLVVLAAAAGTAAAQPTTLVEKATGGLTVEEVTAVVTADTGIVGCVAAETHGIHARATIKVDKTGAVTKVKLARLPSRYKKCVTAALKALAFTQARAAATATVAIDNPSAMENEAAKYAALLISSDDPAPAGDMSSRRTPGVDLDTQIRESSSSGGTVAVGGSTGRSHTPDEGTGKPSPPPAGPLGRVSVHSKDVTGGLTADQILAKVMAAYMAGIKRCYKTALAGDPTLSGPVVVSFDVGTDGRTSAVSVTGVVADCIKDRAETWRFLAKDASSHARIELQLVPD